MRTQMLAKTQLQSGVFIVHTIQSSVVEKQCLFDLSPCIQANKCAGNIYKNNFKNKYESNLYQTDWADLADKMRYQYI